MVKGCVLTTDKVSTSQVSYFAISYLAVEKQILIYRIIIAFKGAVRFFAIFSLRRKLSPTRTFKWPEHNCVQIMCNTLRAYHMHHVVLCATQYEGTAQLLSLTEFKLHLF